MLEKLREHRIEIILAAFFAFCFGVVGEFFKVNHYLILFVMFVVFSLVIWGLGEYGKYRKRKKRMEEGAKRVKRYWNAVRGRSRRE